MLSSPILVVVVSQTRQKWLKVTQLPISIQNVGSSIFSSESVPFPAMNQFRGIWLWTTRCLVFNHFQLSDEQMMDVRFSSDMLWVWNGDQCLCIKKDYPKFPIWDFRPFWMSQLEQVSPKTVKEFWDFTWEIDMHIYW